MQWTWTRGAIFLSLDMQAAADTTIIASTTREYVTVPATNYDMVLSYDFEQGGLFGSSLWKSGLSATLTVNNLTNDFSSTTNVNPETGERETYVLNPIYEWTQGRSYRLSLRKSF